MDAIKLADVKIEELQKFRSSQIGMVLICLGKIFNGKFHYCVLQDVYT